MAKYRYFALTVLILLAISRLSFAAPNASTVYLMNEPVCLLDFGLYMLDKHLDGFVGAGDPYVTPYVMYDWDSNRIIIGIWYTGNDLKTRSEAKNWSDSIICETRLCLGINCSTAKSTVPTGNSLIYQYFSHQGHQSKNEPKNLGSEIDKIVKIKIGAYWGKTEGSKKVLHCEVPLLSTQILYSD